MSIKLFLKRSTGFAAVALASATVVFADTNPVSTLSIAGNSSTNTVIKLNFATSGLAEQQVLGDNLKTKIIFSNANVSDIKSMQFIGTDTKTNIVLSQDSSDAVATLNYVYPDMNFETVFHKPGSFLVSINVLNAVNSVVSSATLPLTINSSQVLGTTTAAFKRTLRFGNSGADVKTLQQILREKGYFNYKSNTGYFGVATKAALQAFQQASFLPATGIFDAATRIALGY